MSDCYSLLSFFLCCSCVYRCCLSCMDTKTEWLWTMHWDGRGRNGSLLIIMKACDTQRNTRRSRRNNQYTRPLKQDLNLVRPEYEAEIHQQRVNNIGFACKISLRIQLVPFGDLHKIIPCITDERMQFYMRGAAIIWHAIPGWKTWPWIAIWSCSPRYKTASLHF
jgi:hypothetical protein